MEIIIAFIVGYAVKVAHPYAMKLIKKIIKLGHDKLSKEIDRLK